MGAAGLGGGAADAGCDVVGVGNGDHCEGDLRGWRLGRGGVWDRAEGGTGRRVGRRGGASGRGHQIGGVNYEARKPDTAAFGNQLTGRRD